MQRMAWCAQPQPEEYEKRVDLQSNNTKGDRGDARKYVGDAQGKAKNHGQDSEPVGAEASVSKSPELWLVLRFGIWRCSVLRLSAARKLPIRAGSPSGCNLLTIVRRYLSEHICQHSGVIIIIRRAIFKLSATCLPGGLQTNVLKLRVANSSFNVILAVFCREAQSICECGSCLGVGWP